jgi:hypothetical protein
VSLLHGPAPWASDFSTLARPGTVSVAFWQEVQLLYNASYCAILGLPSPVTKSEVSRAYRQISLCTHPDRLLSRLKRQPTKFEVQRGTTLFDKFTQARDGLQSTLKKSGEEQIDCFGDVQLEGFIWTTIKWVFDFVATNISIWSGFDMVSSLYNTLAADGWSMEDFFLLLLLYTIFKLCWRFLKWAFGFGWRGPFLFAATFIVGPIPTIGYFVYLPFLRVYALFVGSDKKEDDGKLAPDEGPDDSRDVQQARAKQDAKRKDAKLKARTAEEQKVIDAPDKPEDGALERPKTLFGIVTLRPPQELLKGNKSLQPVRDFMAGAVQFDILIVFMKPIIPLAMLLCFGQVFDGSLAFFVIGFLVSKFPRLGYESLHVSLIFFGFTHTVLGVRGDIMQQAKSKEVLQLMWSFGLRDIMSLGDLIINGATYTAGSSIGNDPLLTTTFSSGMALRIMSTLVPWTPGPEYAEALLAKGGLNVKFENHRESVVAGWGVGDCGGGMFRSFFGSYAVFAVYTVKLFLLAISLQSVTQWFQKLRKVKTVRKNRIRIWGRVLLFLAGIVQVYLILAIDLNASQGTLVNFWITALASGAAESLMCTYEVRGDVRRVVVLLLFLMST